MLIPIGDLNPVRRTPWVMRLLLLANVLVFVGWQPALEGPCARLQFFVEHAAIPYEVVNARPLTTPEVEAMATRCALQPAPDKDVFLALFVSLFLHGDVLHLAVNMLFLWVFGNNVEDRFGHARFLMLYLAWGWAASVVFVASQPDAAVPLVGASGAVAGVLGAYLVLHPTAWVQVLVIVFPVRLPALIVLGLWFVEQLRRLDDPATGGGVAYLAHVAGFVVGAVGTLLAGRHPPARTDRRRRRPPP